MLQDVAFVLSIVLLSAAGAALIKVLAAQSRSESLQSFAALT